ncbi:hypothetical protein VK792_00290 [Mesobacterium sp. TK19101]|uniref:Invasion associated locus B family protein n=1 Tax=Mesobacterium hydrothermale TaxID=3111907 RepID=A0ABU6HCX8_9RHOB|nr:hypothetical protein [Mesobacterium sp. TK19101]MEC3859705.1 hypothetical protein [Mesobacterium sp. TK19101]
MNRAGLIAALVLSAAPAFAGDWFQHKFGELRSYHGDWLAVCNDAGAGPCRAVQTAVDPGSAAYFDQRLAVHRIDGTPDWAVELMDRGMPDAIESLRFTFDGVATDVPSGAWKSGELVYANVAETVTITDPTIAADLVAKMKAGNRLMISYAPQGSGDGSAAVSLRGITAAANAIEARVLPRQE